MTTLIAIPARYASTRYPGKPLVTLKGPDGEKTLIRRSWEAATAVKGIDRVVVATDFSDGSRVALQTALRLFGASHLTLFHAYAETAPARSVHGAEAESTGANQTKKPG